MSKMTTERWNHLYQEMKDSSDEVLVAKANNYATDDDRLFNFEIGSKFMQTLNIPAGKSAVCYSYLTKHLSRLSKMMATTDSYTAEDVREVFGDIRNYMYLLEACMYADDRIKDANYAIIDNTSHHYFSTTSSTC